MKKEGSFSVIILAAGYSSRMKYPKIFLPFDDNRTFMEKIIDTYADSGVSDIVMVINQHVEKKVRSVLSMNPEYDKIKIVLNHFPERGRFYSLQQGVENPPCSTCFIQNADNPFISVELLNKMMGHATVASYVVPVYMGKAGHPVLAGRDIMKYLLLEKGDDCNLRKEFEKFSRIEVSWPHEDILVNINTPSDYQNVFGHAKCLSEIN